MRISNPTTISPFLNKSNHFKPTTMKGLFKSIYNDEDDKDDPLQKQFKTLQMEWDSIKQSFSRSNRRSSTTTVAGDRLLVHFSDDSPKELMALLQNENTPSKECFPNSGDIIEQPEAEFDDNRLDGIRLFEESEVGSDGNGGCFDMDEESEVSTEFSCKGVESYDEKSDQVGGLRCSCTDSPRSDVAEGGGVVVAAKNGGGRGGSAGKWCISVVVMLFALAIVALECSSEHKHILVPT